MSPEVRKKYDEMGVVTAPGSLADFDKFVRSEVVRWGKATRAMDVTGQR
jgi:tripartite-type tricarboxylate transporter receptor subunit TctC